MENLDIFQSVKSEAIKDIVPEILETTFDSLTDSETLKDIPIVGLAFKGYSLYQNITESFFLKKLLRFLFEIKDIPFEKRIDFISELEVKEETNKAGEKLLITLNRLNDFEKAKIIGRLFRHTILEQIEFEDFNRLSHIIDNAYISDIMHLKNNLHLDYIEADIKSNLSQKGLLTQSVSDIFKQQEFLDHVGSSSKAKPKLEYSANKYSKILIQFGFE